MTKKKLRKLVLADRQFVRASLINFIWLLEHTAKSGSEVSVGFDSGAKSRNKLTFRAVAEFVRLRAKLLRVMRRYKHEDRACIKGAKFWF